MDTFDTRGSANPLVIERAGERVAKLAYGARAGFAGAPGLTGYIGWYEATDPAAGIDLLRQATTRLFEMGVDRVVGPLDGSTWHRYRLTLPDDGVGEPPFLGEPVNPPDHPFHFEQAGFVPHLEYESRIVREPGHARETRDATERLRASGIEIEGVDGDGFHALIGEIHRLSLTAFAANPYFTPIGIAEFTRMYEPARALADPALLRLARDRDGRLLGFVFAYADPLAPSPRVILKTLATHPDARGLGLGGLLTEQINAAAGARGAPVIHALMQVTNFSKRISARSESELFRRYRLFIAEPA
jgi:GNAT superfamily N-acetyltransferase